MGRVAIVRGTGLLCALWVLAGVVATLGETGVQEGQEESLFVAEVTTPPFGFGLN